MAGSGRVRANAKIPESGSDDTHRCFPVARLEDMRLMAFLAWADSMPIFPFTGRVDGLSRGRANAEQCGFPAPLSPRLTLKRNVTLHWCCGCSI